MQSSHVQECDGLLTQFTCLLKSGDGVLEGSGVEICFHGTGRSELVKSFSMVALLNVGFCEIESECEPELGTESELLLKKT